MKIVAFGSCLSGNMAYTIKNLSDGVNVVSSVASVRSDYFYKNFISRETDLIERQYIESRLVETDAEKNNPNYVEPSVLLDYQYPETIGARGAIKGKSFLEIIQDGEIDVLIMDNHVDLSSKLSYRIGSDKKLSGVMLRANDYENYKDFFELGEILSVDESVEYFKKIINFIRLRNPLIKIFFVHYPSNTYIKNVPRQIRAVEFQEKFKNDSVVILKAPIINRGMSIENDPAHFKTEIYTALAGFVLYYYENFSLSGQNNLGRVSVVKNCEPPKTLPEKNLSSLNSWSVLIKFHEYETGALFNFLLGTKGSGYSTIVRRRNELQYREKNGDYIGGATFRTGKTNNLILVYKKGLLSFFNNGIAYSIVRSDGDLIINAMGNIYTDKYTAATAFSKLVILDRALRAEEICSDIGDFKVIPGDFVWDSKTDDTAFNDLERSEFLDNKKKDDKSIKVGSGSKRIKSFIKTMKKMIQ